MRLDQELFFSRRLPQAWRKERLLRRYIFTHTPPHNGLLIYPAIYRYGACVYTKRPTSVQIYIHELFSYKLGKRELLMYPLHHYDVPQLSKQYASPYPQKVLLGNRSEAGLSKGLQESLVCLSSDSFLTRESSCETDGQVYNMYL
ncbi:hypothetical protein CSUI_008126 [Cystoisospora suis]|uniref:Uncharacterized protein n=1 Tax=Cystoisospora suis TaxID=483139 RepID=A0A2C6JQK4_9APIC|nr:hypothetical protein CSUI_008126 [Cystoisospora suis]